MAELADALDLGSSVNDVGVRVSLSAPKRKVAKAAFSFCTFHSSLFTLHFSLTSPVRLFQRRDKREDRKEKVAFLPLVEKH